jgi:hypothetical protein
LYCVASASALLTSMTAATRFSIITQVAPSPGDESQIAPANLPPGSDTFDLSTMDGALPHHTLVC